MSDAPYQSAHRLGSTINIWAYVEPGEGEDSILVSPFWVPKGIFTLVWNLVTLGLDTGVPLATFNNPGIVLRLQGQKVTVLKEGLSSQTQYWMMIDNQYALEQALLGYDINFGRSIGRLRKRYIYDPTIIVATDPIDPPPGEGGP